MEYEYYEDVIDAYEAGIGVEEGDSLTDYIRKNNIKIKEIEPFRTESKADGGAIGIEVLFTDKMANGGRVPMVSGGALKAIGSGIMKMFSKGDDVVDLAKQEEIFRSGNITTEFLENVDDKVIKKFISTRDAKGVGGYGLYDNFDDMPNGLKAAELISRIKNAEGGINYEAAELFIGKKLKGNETVNELIKMVITEKKADGGRVGLFMGGDPLTGQALSIYNSMNMTGATDKEIADRLTSLGLYDPNASTPDIPSDNIIGSQINQGGGGGGIMELQETFRTEPGDPKNFRLSQLEGTTDYFPPTTMMGKTKNFIQEKFFQPKVKGTLGDRLLKQSQTITIPTLTGALAKLRSPFNPQSPTYNAALPMQLNFLEATTGKKITGTSDNLKVTEGLGMIGRDPNSGLLKYGSGSVLSGKNVISGFGSNDYETALNKYITRMELYTKPTKFQQAKIKQARDELAALQAEKEKQYIDSGTQAEVRALQKEIDSGKYSGGSAFAQANQAAVGGGSTATNAQGQTAAQATAAGTGTSQGYSQHYARGGLASMFTRRR